MREERLEAEAPDGRTVVFHVAGPRDGDLLVFHTGTPGTPHLEPGMVRECEKRDLRIVCIARPGYSGSTRLQGRTYADGPADTALVADKLGVERFYVHGHSGGGPPALADAVHLPGRVRSAAVSAALAPLPAMGSNWWEGLKLANGEEFEATKAGEDALRLFLDERAKAMRAVASAADVLDDPQFSTLYAPPDRACFTGKYLEFVLTTYPLVVSHGVDGWIDDNFALLGDWGFDLSQIDTPATIWQGGQDNIIPIAHAEWLAENIPDAELRFLPDEGHVSLLNNHFGDILDDLIKRGR